MDTSKNYIKMCRQADEVRNNWKPKLGDYFYGTPQDFADMEYEKGIFQFLLCDDEFYNIIPDTYDPRTKTFNGIGDDDEAVYLPRQDDLQDMIDFEIPLDIINDFQKWCNNLDNSMLERLKTLEQFWLAYMMWVNHSKIWNGKDWEHVNFS
ncbi:MAG: hypothetical protein K9N06_08900 [Candidatus Cloacimonetes bacterium]|nr:hypothetical protein [Candidatus Cloacimonadota bacterium]